MTRVPHARRFKRGDLLPALLALTALVLGTRIFAFFLLPESMQVGFDEGYEAAAVERIIDGKGLPYVDAASIRGPFLYWSLAIVQLVSGRFQWTGTRLIGLLSCVAIVAGSFLSGWAAGWPLAGAIAAVTYVYVVAIYYAPGGGIGVHAEPVGIAFISVAFFLVAYGLYRASTPRTRVVWLVLGGAFIAMGVLTKQTLALCCGPMFVWVVAVAYVKAGTAPDGGRARWGSVIGGWVVPFAAGGLGLLLLVMLRYALAGELRTFFFWSSGIAANVYMAPYKGRVTRLVVEWFMGEPWALFGSILALTSAFAPALGRMRDLSPRGFMTGFGESAFETTVGSMGLALLLAAAIPLRIWPHYFYPVWPFFGMIIGVIIERFAMRFVPNPRAAQAIVVALFGTVLLVTGLTRLDQLRRDRTVGNWVSPRPDPVCAEIDRIAGPGREAIFIWGVAGDLYITCQRRSASMFTATTLVMGIVPPFWGEPKEEYVPKGSREKVLSELVAKPPKVILDHSIAGAGTAMMDLPIYAAFVNERYCRLSVMTSRTGRTMTFFARKDLSACHAPTP